MVKINEGKSNQLIETISESHWSFRQITAGQFTISSMRRCMKAWIDTVLFLLTVVGLEAERFASKPTINSVFEYQITLCTFLCSIKWKQQTSMLIFFPKLQPCNFFFLSCDYHLFLKYTNLNITMCLVLAEVAVTLVNKRAVRNSTRGKFTVFPLSRLLEREKWCVERLPACQQPQHVHVGFSYVMSILQMLFLNNWIGLQSVLCVLNWWKQLWMGGVPEPLNEREQLWLAGVSTSMLLHIYEGY